MIRTTLVLLALLSVVPINAEAQESPSGTELDPVLQEVVAKMDAGEDEAALALLESMRAQPDPPVQALALLGALYAHSGRPLDALDVLEPLTQLDAPNPAVLFNAGKAAMALSQLERAAGFYQRSVEIQPSGPASRELGLLMGGQGLYTQALALLKPWAAANPSDLEVRLAAAFCAVQLERVPDAEELLSDLPQDQPQVSLLWGRLLLIKGDPWGALNTLNPVLDKTPEAMQLDVRRALAEAYASVGQAGDAVSVLAGYSETDPSVALQLSQAQYQSGDLEGALATLRPFAEGLVSTPNPNVPPAVAGRMVLHFGRFLAMSGQREEALPYLERATEVNPDEKQAWQMLGQTLAGLGRRDEAQVALEHFQEISKAEVSASKQDMQARAERDDPALGALRESFALMGEEKYEEALARIRQERALSSGDIRPVLLEGRLLNLLGRREEALATANNVVAAAPDNADAVYLRGTILMAMGDARAAEVDFRQALTLQPEHTATMNDLAVLLMNAGNTTEARQLLEQVLARNPNDALAAENLSSLEG